MSIKKTKRVELVMSEEEKKQLHEIAERWDSSESYVLRRSLKLLYEKEFQGNMNCEEVK